MHRTMIRRMPITGAHDAFLCDSLEKSTVVVVDDDVEFCALLRRKLLGREYRVETFYSAQEYLHHPRPDGPSCILLDIQMPGITGLEVQELLRQDELAPPIIFVTGLEDLETCLFVMKKGAEDYLIKPFKEERLFEAVNCALAKCVQNRDTYTKQKRARELLGTLTLRERQVFALIIKGKMNKEIAVELGLAQITIKVHRACLLRKLGAHSIVDLVRLATCAEILRL